MLQETLRQSQATSKEHYLSNAKSCVGKDLKEFDTWLDDVSRFATISNKDCTGIAITTSKVTLHKYINELVPSGMSWLPIKAQLQERFSECGSSSMANHKLTQLKQLDLPMHEYIAKFGDIAEHAYGIKPRQCQPNFGLQSLLREYRPLMLKSNRGHSKLRI